MSSHAEAWRLAPDNGKTQGFSNVVEFALGVYGQLSMIQRDIGALTSSPQAIVERLDASEKHAEARAQWTAERQAQEARWDARCNRIETRLENFEARTESRFHQIDTRFDTLETHVDKVETNLTRRIDANGQQIATLRERVNKVLWVATGGGIVLGLAYGWKPAIERMAGLIGP
ncbi:hypothetical protein [Cupriavidus pauculus]|uniref:hypothetical protein n=1 Tax=Cupriavidus pauculus TaxID=82633 RepID=UPI001EE3677A|nr:hypothetical protein [Cupriavidus pauculus]GJG92926.1 hypothetical protein CBA19C6_00575 [Cupriavidus pauculus]